MNFIKRFSKIILTRCYSKNWAFESQIHFFNKLNTYNYKFQVKYIDTDVNNKDKTLLLLLPNNPGDSDNYINFCSHLNNHNYRVVVPNFPRSNKVKKISFSQSGGYSSEIMLQYLNTFLGHLGIDRVDLLLADGWSGYDALLLESVYSKSHVMLVNFPKIFDIRDAYIGSIPIELTNTMSYFWRNIVSRFLFKKYIEYKLPSICQETNFTHLSSEEIMSSLLCYGGVNFEYLKQITMVNCSESLGLINLLGYKSGYNRSDETGYRDLMGLLHSDVFTVDIDHGDGISNIQLDMDIRNRYEVNLVGPYADEKLTIDSDAFSEFIVLWIDKLRGKYQKVRRLGKRKHI